MKKRIFVEKRGIFDVESPKVLNEIKSILPNIQSMKVYNVYDVFGLDESDFEKVVNNTFVDPVVDILHHKNPAKSICFATEFLPGQYDQRADSAQQCIALLTGNEKSTVRSGKLIELQGIAEVDLPSIKNLLINKVESQEKNLEILEIPAEEKPDQIKVYTDFNDYTTSQLNDFYNNHGFSFGFDDLQFIQDYFKSEN
jgi:phosphoribosylformylglycinamidine synthase